MVEIQPKKHDEWKLAESGSVNRGNIFCVWQTCIQSFFNEGHLKFESAIPEQDKPSALTKLTNNNKKM